MIPLCSDCWCGAWNKSNEVSEKRMPISKDDTCRAACDPAMSMN